MERTRVVITGLGTVNPLANSIEEFWQGLQAGKSGITTITHFDASELPCGSGPWTLVLTCNEFL